MALAVQVFALKPSLHVLILSTISLVEALDDRSGSISGLEGNKTKLSRDNMHAALLLLPRDE